jgi:crotonobetainyl-CoA:carnitine CoA-transferase CaiB-like acyl-CoA transferase
VPNIETPITMDLTPAVEPVAAPLLGQHTNEILRDTLGYDETRIAVLSKAGAFGKAAG